MKKLNNRGFTLIEVLAVIVILVIIVAIAIPNISASLDRQTCKTTVNKAKLIESAAQFYVSDNRNNIIKNMGSEDKCVITTKELEGKYFNSDESKWELDNDKKKYITADDLKDGNNEEMNGKVIYDKLTETYTFCFVSSNGCPDLSVCSETFESCDIS